MAENRTDSAIEMDVWTDGDHDIIQDDDDDDVFELLSSSEEPDPELLCRPARPARGKRRQKGRGQQEVGAPGSASVKPHLMYSLLSMTGRQYAIQGNTPSIITHLHPTFLLDPAPASPSTTTTTPTQPQNSPTPTTEATVGMVTLHSLGCCRDSGYVPSPTSAQSFTFSSDEDEPKAAPAPRPGVTPPIAIPHARRHRPPTKEQEEQPRQDKTTPKSPEEEDLTTPKSPEEEDLTTPSQRCRTRSCPEQVRLPAVPRTPVPRFPSTLTPSHGRNWSTPATTPDGQPLLTPSPLEARANTPRASRDALIDLTEEDGRVSGGHRRRVLVLALPDVVIDTEGRASGACTPPSAQSPGGHHPESRDSFELDSCRLGGTRPRPAWRRPRALSCDVTLEEEVGQELRRIADRFHRDHAAEIADAEQATVWRRLRNSFRKSCTSLFSSSQSGE